MHGNGRCVIDPDPAFVVVRVSSDCSGKPSSRCRALNRQHLPHRARADVGHRLVADRGPEQHRRVGAQSRVAIEHTPHRMGLVDHKKRPALVVLLPGNPLDQTVGACGGGRNVTSHRADASSATTGLAWPRRPMVCVAAPGTPAAHHNATQVPPHGGIARGPPRHVGRGAVALGTPSPTPGLCHPSVAVGTCDQLAVGITQGRGGKAGCWHLRSSWRLGANAPHTREEQVVRAWWSTSFVWSARMRTR